MATHSVLPVLLVAALTSAVVSGAVVAWTTRAIDEPAPPGAAVAPRVPAADGLPDAGAEMATLQALRLELAAVRGRLDALEARAAATSRVPAEDWITREELAAALAALRRGPGPPSVDGPRGSPNADSQQRQFQQQVAQALDAIQKETVAKKFAAAAGQLEDRLADLGKLLALTPHQTVEMRAILTARDASDRELVALWQQDADASRIAEHKLATAQRFDDEMQRVLTAEQLANWRDSQGGGSKPKPAPAATAAPGKR